MTATKPGSGTLWRTEGFPHRGWTCTAVVDLNPDGKPTDDVEYETCEVCGHYPIRFVHTIEHPEWNDSLDVGCICVEKLTDDYVNPRNRESDLRKRAARRATFNRKPWRTSAKGNRWLKIDGHHSTVFNRQDDPSAFGAVVDGKFSQRTFRSEQEAMLACYEYVQRLRHARAEA